MKKYLKIFILSILLLSSGWSLNAEKLFILNSNSESITRYNTETGNITSNILSVGQYANQIKIHNNLAYIVNSGEHNIQIVDIETETTLDFIQCPNGSNPYWIEIIPQGEKAYLTGLFTNTVYVINLNSGEIVNSISVGNGPEGIYYYEGKLFVMNTCYGSDNGTISVIDSETDSVIETVEVGNNPQFADIDSAERLHVVCTGNYSNICGEVHIIDLQDYSLYSIVEIGGSPTRIAIHPNGTAYLGDGNGQGYMTYDVETFSILHSPNNKLSNGGTFVKFDSEGNLYLGDALDWVNNGKVHILSPEENHITDITVGVAPIDATLYAVNGNDEEPQASSGLYSYNCPNPFTSSTTIYLKNNASISIKNKIGIYNVKGQLIETLSEINMENPQNHKATWDGRDRNGNKVPAGIYFYKIQTEGRNTSFNKMILLDE